MKAFEELLAEGESVPVEGWDFSWFEGRGSEERPSWGYSRLLGDRMARASVAVDLQTGGGEVLAEIPHPPAVLMATESWPPNVDLARRNLKAVGATVIEIADDADLPFPSNSFDLVVSRHPTVTRWDEVARVLGPGGRYLSQQVGDGSGRELAEFLTAPQPPRPERRPERVQAAAEAAGLHVDVLRQESPRTRFDDIAAVLHFLRKVVWVIPGFTVDRYRDRLAALDARIRTEGPFVAHAPRVLIEARKPS